ncbi:MAG: sugar phosphate isomerase/epimerase [Planctomycetes bacterium]|nr:sugar phosphate isomerase/epimerase [Planctomycetota bacterium]
MNDRMTRRTFVTNAAGLAGLALAAGRGSARAGSAEAEKKPASGSAPPPPPPWKPWPFYAFENGLGTIPKFEDKVKLLADLGYAGIGAYMNHHELPKQLELLDERKLKLFSLYNTPVLGETLDPGLAISIRRLKGRDTRIELGIRRDEATAPSDPDGDERAMALIRPLSALCGDTGPVVSIYPHAGFWTERVEDGVRLARLSRRKNVGTNFNLVHWHWIKQERPLEVVLKEALPCLFLVSINGHKGRDIVPLDEGDYDVLGFLRVLKKVGYKGPVGLQCYSVKGPSEVHLERSIGKWREWMKILAKPDPRPAST